VDLKRLDKSQVSSQRGNQTGTNTRFPINGGKILVATTPAKTENRSGSHTIDEERWSLCPTKSYYSENKLMSVTEDITTGKIPALSE
jgi:hypothetical protein